VLLNNGADPRLHASDGTSPLQVSLRTSGKENRKIFICYVFQVAAIAEVEEFLKSWNIEQTDELLKKLEENKERKLKEEQKQQKQECDK
jgi:hypothetical protein